MLCKILNVFNGGDRYTIAIGSSWNTHIYKMQRGRPDKKPKQTKTSLSLVRIFTQVITY